jgi:hypothetical protein
MSELQENDRNIQNNDSKAKKRKFTKVLEYIAIGLVVAVAIPVVILAIALGTCLLAAK